MFTVHLWFTADGLVKMVVSAWEGAPWAAGDQGSVVTLLVVKRSVYIRHWEQRDYEARAPSCCARLHRRTEVLHSLQTRLLAFSIAAILFYGQLSAFVAGRASGETGARIADISRFRLGGGACGMPRSGDTRKRSRRRPSIDISTYIIIQINSQTSSSHEDYIHVA